MRDTCKFSEIQKILEAYGFEINPTKPNFVIFSETYRVSTPEGEKIRVLELSAKNNSKALKYSALLEILNLFENDEEVENTKSFLNKLKSPLLTTFEGKLTSKLNANIF